MYVKVELNVITPDLCSNYQTGEQENRSYFYGNKECSYLGTNYLLLNPLRHTPQPTEDFEYKKISCFLKPKTEFSFN